MNQQKDNVGGGLYEAKLKTYGGHAMLYHSSLRLLVKKFTDEKDKNGDIVGIWVRGRCEKNDINAPREQGEFLIDFKNGVDREKDLLEAAIRIGCVARNGGWLAVPLKDTIKKFRATEWPEIREELYGTIQETHDLFTQKALDKLLMLSYDEIPE